MMEITVHCPEMAQLAEALNRLGTLPSAVAPAEPTPAVVPGPMPSAPAANVIVATEPRAAVPAAVPTAPAPASVPATPVANVPVAAPSAYTLEQLSLAGRQLADAGRMTEVQQLVAQFGAQTMMQIPPEKYGEFATALRGMGARI